MYTWFHVQLDQSILEGLYYTPSHCMGREDSHLLELHPLCGIVICQSNTKVCLKSIVFSKLTVTVRRMAEHEQSHSHYVGCAKLALIGT